MSLSKLLTITMVILAVMGAVALQVLDSQRPDEPAPQAVEQPVVRQDAELIEIAQTLGIDYSKLNLSVGTEADLGKGVAGDFALPNTIRINTNRSLRDQYVTLAHEYYHYVQNNIDAKGSASFNSYLESLETSNSYLRGRIAPYRTGEACAGTCEKIQQEAQAVACTEIPDDQLRVDFVAWCTKYVPDRAVLFL